MMKTEVPNFISVFSSVAWKKQTLLFFLTAPLSQFLLLDMKVLEIEKELEVKLCPIQKRK